MNQSFLKRLQALETGTGGNRPKIIVRFGKYSNPDEDEDLAKANENIFLIDFGDIDSSLI